MLRRAEGSINGVHDEIGPKIRAARLARGYSLRQLAGEVGVSASLLSQVETGKVQPSVATLYALVSALGGSLDRMLGVAGGRKELDPYPEGALKSPFGGDQLPEATKAVVQRRNENPTLDMDNGVRWERLSGSSDVLEILLVTYQKGASSSAEGKLMRHSGHEFVYLLEGTLTVQVGFDVFEVEAGDSFNFESTQPHMYVNRSEGTVRGIWYTLRADDSGLPGAMISGVSTHSSTAEVWRALRADD